jgi:hypothetical protein
LIALAPEKGICNIFLLGNPKNPLQNLPKKNLEFEIDYPLFPVVFLVELAVPVWETATLDLQGNKFLILEKAWVYV